MLSSALLTLRQASRQLWRQPRFALAAIVAIALGVAAVGTVFALIDATLLRPLSVPAGERLLGAHRSAGIEASISLPDARHWRRELRGIDAFAVVSTDWSLDWVRPEGPRHLQAGLTESEYFRALSAPPLLGRLLNAADDRPGAAPVVVLDEKFWRSEFGANPQVLGREMQLSGVSARVVGVASAASDLWESGMDLWVPIPAFAPWAENSPGSNNFEVIARQAPNISLATARAELATVNQRLIDSSAIGEHKRLSVRPLTEALTLGSRRGLWLVLGFGGLVLLLAGANVAALQVVRASARRADLRVRHALGAQPGRLRRELLLEASVLGLVGGLLGLLLALLAFTLLRTLAADALPRLAQGQTGWATLLFAPASALLTVWLVATLAARHATRHLTQGPGQRVVGTLPLRLLGGFVVMEVTLAVLLLTASALLLRSFQSLASVPLGFAPQGVVTAELVLPEAGYGKKGPQSRAVSGIVAALATQPGVREAAFVVGLPLTGSGRIGHSFVLDGALADGAQDDAGAQFRPFHGDYFAAAGLQVVSGRAPIPADLEVGERLAWVNQRFVEIYLQGRDPIGQRVAWTPGEAADAALGPQWMRIVGVVADVRASSLRDGDSAAVYAPYLQRDDAWIRFGQLLARVDGDPARHAETLQRAVSAIDPSVALSATQPWASHVDRALRPTRLQLMLTGSFALIAAVLGLQGIAGVVAFATGQRRRELGLRMALGASAGAMLRLVLLNGLRHIAAGILLGAVAAWWLAHGFAALLHGVDAADGLSYATVALGAAGAGLLATWWSARRVLRLDPQIVLRDAPGD